MLVFIDDNMKRLSALAEQEIVSGRISVSLEDRDTLRWAYTEIESLNNKLRECRAITTTIRTQAENQENRIEATRIRLKTLEQLFGVLMAETVGRL